MKAQEERIEWRATKERRLGEGEQNTSCLDDIDPWFLGYSVSDRLSVAFANMVSYLFLFLLASLLIITGNSLKEMPKLDPFGNQTCNNHALVTALQLERRRTL